MLAFGLGTIDHTDPFHAIAISRLAHELKAQGRSIIHMEFGQPSTGAPKAAIERAHHVLDTDGMGYWESPALRQRLARHYAESYGAEVEEDRFVITCGASPALVLALLSAFEPGDRVALARPGYVAYRNTLKSLHLEPVEIACQVLPTLRSKRTLPLLMTGSALRAVRTTELPRLIVDLFSDRATSGRTPTRICLDPALTLAVAATLTR